MLAAAWLGMRLILGDSAKVRMGLEMSSGVLDLQALELRDSFKNRLVLRLCITSPLDDI